MANINATKVLSALDMTIKSLDFTSISKERKALLHPLTSFLQEKSANQQTIRLNFICTHNSRRSHLSQIWAQTLAYYCGIKHVFCYSGGTEATALFPGVLGSLETVGFKFSQLSEGKNPVYAIKYAENEAPIIGFSKKYDDDFNPSSAFAAILTCSSADVGCPFIVGAEKRIPITFEDPKLFDHTSQQEQKYLERNLQIATELFYVFSKIKG